MSRLARTEPYARTAADLGDPASILVRSGDEDKRRLDETLGRILDCAVVIPPEYDCRLITSFAGGLGYIDSQQA